mmetsp:Transcript_2634/g.8138  ORF Transcript_2634/g.8138 Transcript_2634/m.8138 type:complete len:217 (+) Transcript_2634:2021-2671(+)
MGSSPWSKTEGLLSLQAVTNLASMIWGSTSLGLPNVSAQLLRSSSVMPRTHTSRLCRSLPSGKFTGTQTPWSGLRNQFSISRRIGDSGLSSGVQHADGALHSFSCFKTKTSLGPIQPSRAAAPPAASAASSWCLMSFFRMQQRTMALMTCQRIPKKMMTTVPALTTPPGKFFRNSGSGLPIHDGHGTLQKIRCIAPACGGCGAQRSEPLEPKWLRT